MGDPDRESSNLRPAFVHFHYPRHFLLLTGFSVLVGLLSRLHAASVFVSFLIYGALHATALILALRTRMTIRRKCSFIVLAAILSVVAVHVGIVGRQLSGAPPASAAFYSLLGLSAAIGAASYATLIRLAGLYALTAWELTVISVGCVFAALVGALTASHVHFLGPWWLAVLWWYTFSGGLWYFDHSRKCGERTCSGRTPRPRS